MDLPEKEGKNSLNPHSVYWSMVYIKYISPYKKIIVILFLCFLSYFGFIKYTPEIEVFFGKFSLAKYEPKDSEVLTRSIFDVLHDAHSGVTSKERVDMIKNISGLSTKEEIGQVYDKGTDGYSLVIRGNSSFGTNGHIMCLFSKDWKKQLSIIKKGDSIRFVGKVDYYDLSFGYEWIALKDCYIIN